MLLLCAFIFGAKAQDDAVVPPVSLMKKDYKQVRIVAHVKIKRVEFVEDKGYVRYLVQSEIVEPFKGKIEAGKNLEYYFWVEKGYNPEKHPREKIVFLEAEPSAAGDLYQLENSGFKPSPKSLALMRRIKAEHRRTAEPSRTRQNKIAQPGFYFNLPPPEANQSVGWQDEMLKQFRSHDIPAFYGEYLSYKGITPEAFVPVKSLKVISRPRSNLTDVWVGPFETEEAAVAALDRFAVVLRPLLEKNKEAQARLQFVINDDSGRLPSLINHTWQIGSITIFGHEVVKPSSKSTEAAAKRDWAAFWTNFQAAVEKRDRKNLRSLMSFSIRFPSYKIFPADRALERLDDHDGELWKKVDRSLATGAKIEDISNSGRPLLLTADGSLLFVFSSNGKWRWLGFIPGS